MTKQHCAGTRIVMLCLALLGMGLVTAVWATEQSATTSDGQSSCEDGQPMLVAAGAGELGKETDPAQPGKIQKRGVPSADRWMFKIISVDPVTGKVVARSMATGEVAQIKVPPAAIPRRKMTSGRKIKITPGANGNCPCGQRADGSCWCVSNIPECCGFPICPMASCDKTQPIP